MVFDWFDAAEAQNFGRTLATYFIEKLPPLEKTSDKKFETKSREALGKMANQVASFRANHRLNFYKKAKLGNAFKWTLREAGFDIGYTDKLTEWLMLQLQ